jgi:hypothetical protein
MTDYPEDADGAALAELEAQGVDMTQPLLIEFAVAAPDEAAATAISEALAGAGYESEIDYDDGEPLEEDPDEAGASDPAAAADDEEEFGPSWTVYAIVELVPEYDEILRIQEELDSLAEPLGGAADGWGVMLEGPEEEE